MTRRAERHAVSEEVTPAVLNLNHVMPEETTTSRSARETGIGAKMMSIARSAYRRVIPSRLAHNRHFREASEGVHAMIRGLKIKPIKRRVLADR